MGGRPFHGAGAGRASFVPGNTGGGPPPIVLGTDIVSGSPVNGENGAGAYLSIFGLNFGTFANLGTNAGARVYIGGAEVANYRVLGNSVVSGIKPEFAAVQRIIVQIGSAAVQALTAGTAYAISVVVNGVASNSADVRGNPLQFTPQPGHFWFVDTVNGNDATGVKDDITHPFRYIQNFGGGTTGATTGIWLTGNLAAGDTIVPRGNGGTPISDQVGYEGRLCRWSNRNLTGGTAPNGTVGHGYVHFTAYPGPIGGNACEDVYIFNPAGGIGGFMGPGTAYGRPNGSAGQYWTCSNMRSDTASNPGSTDASNFNLQSSSDHTRFVNLDVQWNSTSTGAAHQKAGGIVGDGDPVTMLFCHVHNIAGGDPSSLENHGVYLDGANTCAHNVEIGFCIIENCTTGQGIQFHNQVASDQFYNTYVHHFRVENTAKYGLKYDCMGGQIWFWDGTVVGTQREGCELDGTGQGGTPDMHFENITFHDCYSYTGGGYFAVIANEGSNISGNGATFKNCLLSYSSTSGGFASGWVGSAGGCTIINCAYFDYSGRVTTKYSGDTTGVYGNPQYVNPATFPNFDPRIGATSVALGKALTATINPTNDVGMNPQPRAGQTAASVGACA